MIKLQLILLCLLFIQIHSNTCGKNCPSNTCDSCICGTKFDNVSSSTCSTYAWNQNCCKCIISRISNWNKHYMTKGFGFLEIGLFAIDEDDADECNMKASDLCFYGANLKCAYEQYVDYGKTWGYWDYEATACGCPVGAPINFENLKHQRRKEINVMKKQKWLELNDK